ncbi:uncharacterized protein BO96DRAFT_222349 [Aspergillus niger CBS 101883]|uniref:Uncharacterized protein n=2 Tax=Aspergillus TaxID=5052 RepID=A0A370P447_ASPPH|nr:uncharacterized protein BO96DRAFT_222349 [Aspergillus niger CBS 101883]PYH50579.1 hypothetical protein BO96DRAFT_222349 [Aspergillus niger CBS 101883]RDH22969.1 hypothetical protein M747DRAFT_175702 [Aspergillus niger ATCC 13496]RDK36645.1 hypothetical protein M752DRAFT_113311 [Aspergillus phoenicis ATCC 13157]
MLDGHLTWRYNEYPDEVDEAIANGLPAAARCIADLFLPETLVLLFYLCLYYLYYYIACSFIRHMCISVLVVPGNNGAGGGESFPIKSILLSLLPQHFSALLPTTKSLHLTRA